MRITFYVNLCARSANAAYYFFHFFTCFGNLLLLTSGSATTITSRDAKIA